MLHSSAKTDSDRLRLRVVAFIAVPAACTVHALIKIQPYTANFTLFHSCALIKTQSGWKQARALPYSPRLVHSLFLCTLLKKHHSYNRRTIALDQCISMEYNVTSGLGLENLVRF